jgi:hypothetical protein
VSQALVDRIDENTAGAGVTIASLLVKGGSFPTPRLYFVRDAVGNGIADDRAAINAKIAEAAAAGGGKVMLGGGTFRITGALAMAQNVTLCGAGGGTTTVRLADGANSLLVYASFASDMRVEDIVFDGNAANNPGIATTSVQFDNCTDTEIRHCRFINTKIPVAYRGGARVAVRRCFFANAVDYGVRVSELAATDVWIEGNYFAGITAGVVTDWAAIRLTCSRVFVRDNYIAGSIDTGVMISGTGCRDISVSGNIIRTTQVGVYVGSGAKRTRVIGNDIASTLDFGVHVYDATQIESETVISSNVIHDCGKSGVEIEGVRVVTVTGNIIERVGSLVASADNQRGGIVCTSIGAANCGKVTITDNVIRDDAGAPTMRYGIYIETVTAGLTIWGNQVSNGIVADVDVSGGFTAPYAVQTATDVYLSTNLAGTGRVHGACQSTAAAGVNTPNLNSGDFYALTVNGGAGFTIANPTNARNGAWLTIEVVNVSGGVMGAVTWGAAYRLQGGAFVAPANNKRRCVTFRYDGALWIESNRSAADVDL